MGMSYILWASRRPCGMYKVGQWLCALSDLELRTQNLELRVCLSSAEHGGQVAGDLRGTLDIDPNPNGILPLHCSKYSIQHTSSSLVHMKTVALVKGQKGCELK